MSNEPEDVQCINNYLQSTQIENRLELLFTTTAAAMYK
jgi:hypothetical protein